MTENLKELALKTNLKKSNVRLVGEGGWPNLTLSDQGEGSSENC